MGVPQPVALGAGLALVLGLAKLLLRKRGDDELEGAVANSSKGVAAARALETQEERPLIRDPLAEQLAGAAAMKRVQKRAKAAPAGSDRKNQVSAIAVRTKWFDDQIEAVLGVPVGSLGRLDGYLAKGLELDHAPRQVVVLGAGMDSRPWRLKLPADLSWYEVDTPAVVEAKRRALLAAGAEVPLAMRRSASQAAIEAKVGSLDHHAVQTQHPLRAAAWDAAAADLSQPGWSSELRAAGFVPGRPVVWVAEGLLMYLDEQEVSALLRELAALSGPGSVLLAVTVTEDALADIRARGISSGVRAHWKWGCPADPTEFLAEAGWRLAHSTTRPAMAAALGLPAELCNFRSTADDGDSDASTLSQFLVAALA